LLHSLLSRHFFGGVLGLAADVEIHGSRLLLHGSMLMGLHSLTNQLTADLLVAGRFAEVQA
jgi:hypothetical protein